VRRIRAEWLLLPLFLVPFLGAFSYAAWAKTSYRLDLHRMVERAHELVRQSVEGDQARFWSRQ